MTDNAVKLCQQLRDEAAEAARLAAAIGEKSTRSVLLNLARDLQSVAQELESATTVVVASDERVEQTTTVRTSIAG